MLPEVITHNYDPARGMFLSICSLSRAEAAAVLDDIAVSGTRPIKGNYLERRWATEQWLLSERTKKLAAPRLSHPIYFFLGDFADGLDPSRPASVRLPLSLFSAEMITFTWGDSMTSWAFASEAHRLRDEWFYGGVLTLEEVRRLVSQRGMPHKSAVSYADRFIEVQVWDDRPLYEHRQTF